MRALGLFNILWDGDGFHVGRRTSESFEMKGVRLTISLQTQELTLRTFEDQSNGLARGMGFFARFLIGWPESRQGYRPYVEPPPSWPSLDAFNNRIGALLSVPLPYASDGTLSPRKLSIAPVAKIAWVGFHDAIECELRNDGELREVRDVASKAADNVARLAALFHIYEHGFGGRVGADYIERASRIVTWHLNEARRVLEGVAPSRMVADLIKLDLWLHGRCERLGTNEVLRKDVQNSGPNAFRDGQALDRGLESLVKLGRVRLKHCGRRIDICVNPCLLRRQST
jgi:putative DNA primase/helicase